MDQRELALAQRHTTRHSSLAEHTKTLEPLKLGSVVSVQNQCGNKPKRWDRSGTIIEVKEHQQYLVKMDGSGRPSLRNRRYLRPITPYSSILDPRSGSASPPAPSHAPGAPDIPPATAQLENLSTLATPELRRSSRTSKAPERLLSTCGLSSTPRPNSKTSPVPGPPSLPRGPIRLAHGPRLGGGEGGIVGPQT